MCQEKIMKINKENRFARIRARRILRARANAPLNETPSSSTSFSTFSSSSSTTSSPPPSPAPVVETGAVTNQTLMDIALSTIALIRNNRIIQTQLAILKQETNDFINSVMSNPSNKNIRLKYKERLEAQAKANDADNENSSDSSSMSSDNADFTLNLNDIFNFKR